MVVVNIGSCHATFETETDFNWLTDEVKLEGKIAFLFFLAVNVTRMKSFRNVIM